MQSDFPDPVSFSRRHFIKAIGIAAGAISASLPQAAKAQAEPQWGWPGGGGGTNCFLRGTLVRDINGYRPIETFAIGDHLPTHFSGTAAIRKIISYSVCRDEDGYWPAECRPVRIRAGALGENAPARDLIVTNAHAMFLDGVLVPVEDVVNGTSISFDDQTDLSTLEYFHIEFGTHDVLDAEGALCESHREQTTEPCAPILAFNGRRNQFYSRMRSAIAPLMDRRQPLDRIRDGLEARAGL